MCQNKFGLSLMNVVIKKMRSNENNSEKDLWKIEKTNFHHTLGSIERIF